MPDLADALRDLHRLEELARGDSAIHRLDPRVKVLTTAVFTICVVSVARTEVSRLLPFTLFPLLLAARAGLPARPLLRQLLLASPFLLLLASGNPLVERQAAMSIGPLAISAGWLSFCSILLRGLLTVGSAGVLVATTGFSAICHALERLGLPRLLTLQLLFLYRYLEVLLEEGVRAARARELRAVGSAGLGVASFAPLAGHLLLRTWDRAEQIHRAMLARGFSGSFPPPRESRPGSADYRFLAGWLAFFALARTCNLAQWLGALASGVLP